MPWSSRRSRSRRVDLRPTSRRGVHGPIAPRGALGSQQRRAQADPRGRHADRLHAVEIASRRVRGGERARVYRRGHDAPSFAAALERHLQASLEAEHAARRGRLARLEALLHRLKGALEARHAAGRTGLARLSTFGATAGFGFVN
ncbi:hypothetical protein Ctob_003988 [Chrysochromulina tobinii]|uniref:Uncharacterized protein n=1 Tax=Chrysochromulina tobinii TaxID=1460289 RepID=A0A0M0J729_9EUKA|nr:hypothetical protein Ctob_003988 [Chrysochromulina tobinii]|eukprot:KOO22270.1 hypothetical protein Ctob_003988 [Chrysochromulina sp. CCMP291]